MYKIIEANIYDFGFSDERNRPILHDEIVYIRYEVDGKEIIGIVGRSFLDNINDKIRIAINIENDEIIRPSLQTGWMELVLNFVCLFVAFSIMTDRRAAGKIQLDGNAKNELKIHKNYSEKLQNSILENECFFCGLLFLGAYFAIRLYEKLGEKINRVPIYMTFTMGIVLIVAGVGQIRKKDKIKEEERKILGKVKKGKCKVLFRIKEVVIYRLACFYEEEKTTYWFYKLLKNSLSDYVHIENVGLEGKEIEIYVQNNNYKNYFMPKEVIAEVLGGESILVKGIPLILMVAMLVLVGALALLQYCIY